MSRIPKHIISKKPTGDQYRAIVNIFAIEMGGETFPVWSVSEHRNNVIISSHITGDQSLTKLSISNIYMDSNGNIEFETENTPRASIQSNPPAGYYSVSNIYYDISKGEVIAE